MSDSADVDDERLLERGRSMQEKKVAKGYVPVIVGRSHEDVDAERVMVPVNLFKTPCVKRLLDEAAMEFGYTHEGVLRIICDVQEFRQHITHCGLTG